jgi:hypothetical protein
MAAPFSLRETEGQARAPRRNPRRALAGLALVVCLGFPRGSFAAPGTPAEAPAAGHPSRDYLQYGLALAIEAVASPGGVCPPDTENPCILGSGAGIGVRAGYRAQAPFYIGGAYEFSRHDSSNLLRLAILQQFRGEGRYYFDEGTRTTAFVTAAAGFLLYGNEWSASTAGPLAAVGAGVELELSPSTSLGCILTYRLLMPRKWVDGTGVERANQFLGFGFAHVVGLEFTLEVQDPIPRF